MGISKYLNKEKEATGGLVFIMVSLLMAMALTWSTTLARDTTSSSVAKSVSQQIATECLASQYIHNAGNSSGGTTTFASLTSTSSDVIDPLDQFNSIMHNYKLMAPNSRCESFTWTYNKTSKTFKIDFGTYRSTASWHAFNIVDSDLINPGETYAVIESS